VAAILKGMSQSYESIGQKYKCDVKAPKKIAVKGWTGSEFDLVDCHNPGSIRVYTRVVGEERVLIMGLSFFEQPDPNVKRFLNSFQLKAE
jgi:hypothetical protein